jgi:5-methylcytosine-specific restriction endonuclease McrA
MSRVYRPFNIGDRFGLWTITGYNKVERQYLCRCSCGTISLVGGWSLRNSRSTQCSQCRVNRRSLIGKQFGKWTVLSKIGVDAGWMCQCECGNKQIKRTSDLKLCRIGCRHCAWKSSRKPCGESGFQRKLRQSKRGAIERNLDWSLTDDQARLLFQSDCHYCGLPPEQEVCGGDKKDHSLFLANGIDRKNNSKGYEESNCVSCCGPCNRAKDTMPYEDFISMVNRIAARHPRDTESG